MENETEGRATLSRTRVPLHQAGQSLPADVANRVMPEDGLSHLDVALFQSSI